MKLLSSLPLAALCLALPATAQTLLMGPVTHAGTPQRFTVNTTTVLCAPDTVSVLQRQNTSTEKRDCPQRVLGESVTVHGHTNKSGEMQATRIESEAFDRSRVDGDAVVERVELLNGNPTDRVLHADGYRIHIPATVKPVFLEPLTADTVIAPNLWLRYSGTQEVDGTVTATTITLSRNVLTNREAKRSQKQEFDPSKVEEKDRQGAISSFLLGRNAKRFPAYKDEAMQQRVDSIGAKLVPAFQRTLPDADPAKLNFRFQVVDKKLKDALTLTNGIILIPKQVIERLENDSQLATVLADNIACALEKQSFRQIPAGDIMTGTKIATAAAGLFVPGLGLAAGIGESVASSKIQKHALEQSGRVSLSLLHDAGYDNTQAPVTWWILDSNKPRDKTDIPYRARYLYGQLATTWRNPVPSR